MTNLEVIGKQAFFRTPIDEFEFSYLTNLQTIEKEAFEDTALTKADFKDLYHLQEIGESAFLHSNISYLHFDNNELMKEFSKQSFYRNPLKELHFGNLPNITLIGETAFGPRNQYASQDGPIILRTPVDLSGMPKLEEIGYNAFYNMKFKSINLEGLDNLKNWSECI